MSKKSTKRDPCQSAELWLSLTVSRKPKYQDTSKFTSEIWKLSCRYVSHSNLCVTIYHSTQRNLEKLCCFLKKLFQKKQAKKKESFFSVSRENFLLRTVSVSNLQGWMSLLLALKISFKLGLNGWCGILS